MRSIRKHMKASWDYGFSFQTSDDVTGKILMYDDLQQWGLFLKFLVCPEVSTVYVTHVYGTAVHSFEFDRRTITDVADVPEWMWKDVMPQLFEGYTVVPFNTTSFAAHCQQVYSQTATQRATALTSVFPYNVVQNIMMRDVPEWMLYDHNNSTTSFPLMKDAQHDVYMNEHFDIY